MYVGTLLFIKNLRIMEGKLKRIRFNKDGTLDFGIETEDGKRAIVKGCSLSVDKNNERIIKNKELWQQ